MRILRLGEVEHFAQDLLAVSVEFEPINTWFKVHLQFFHALTCLNPSNIIFVIPSSTRETTKQGLDNQPYHLTQTFTENLLRFVLGVCVVGETKGMGPLCNWEV